MIIRELEDRDLAGVTAIYGQAVGEGLGTFARVPPAVEEMARRAASIRAHGLPWLVVEEDGEVLAYAYASPFRPRWGYRFTVEDSVYVAPAAQGRGLARALLGELIGRCEAMGFRQMLAVIGDSGNLASIGLHRSLGFEDAGAARSVGRKHDRWVDIVIMQRALGKGDGAAPDRPGLALPED
jgi:L-amino acid N-acyltransferase YncA